MSFLKKSFWVLPAMALAACFVACDSDSASASNDEDVSSSSNEAGESSSSVTTSSSSSVTTSSSSRVIPSSSSCVIRNDSEESSSSVKEYSSSNVVLSSSSDMVSSSSVIALGSEKVWSYLNPEIVYEEFTDARDGQKYKSVKIGKQIWMAQNLNYPYSSEANRDVNNDPPRSTCFRNSQDSCVKYGHMYNWAAALDVCPTGWHLPSVAEWFVLLDEVGGQSSAGTALKADIPDLWYSNGNGENSVGFTALPGGERRSADSKYEYEGFLASFWSSTNQSLNVAIIFQMPYGERSVSESHGGKNGFYYVRCLKDGYSGLNSSSSETPPAYTGVTAQDFMNPSVSYGDLKDGRDGQTYKTVKIGSQTWMAQNLNYADTVLTPMLTSETWCYEDVLDSCAKNGRLYTWYAARNVCPSGWHLPEKTEWETLFNEVGGEDVAAKQLRSKSGWIYDGREFTGVGGEAAFIGDNQYGFTVMPVGYRTLVGEYEKGDVDENGLTTKSYFWSATPYSEISTTGIYTYIFDGFGSGVTVELKLRPNAYSVRCVKD